MKNYSRIKFFSLLVCCVMCFYSQANASGKNNSKFGGVQIGAITYSFRSMPDQSLESVLRYAVEAGLSSVELMGTPVEQFAGMPDTKDKEAIRQWRTTVSMDKFKEIRSMFQKKGVKIDILKLGNETWSDEEIDYAFRVCKILGAKGITMEISEKAAKRMAPFAEKHKLFAILHNHGQPGDPDFSFDRILEHGSYLKLNFDVGHYYGATGKNPADLINRLHDRIASLHIKDKTGPDADPKNTNRPLGQGQTPLTDIFKLIQKEKWPITCDIELEYDIPAGSDAVKEVAKCVEYCKQILLSEQ